jgi:hypothetical protein
MVERRRDGDLGVAPAPADVSAWGVVGRLLFRAFVKVHVALYRASGGRLGGRLGKGVPVPLLTTTGRKTGSGARLRSCTSRRVEPRVASGRSRARVI